MSRNVFILGAGASREGGAPLMFDFLDVARQLARGSNVDDARAEFDSVLRAISALQRVHSKCQLDLNNVETVFSAFEMGQILGSLCEYPPAEIRNLVASMRVVIARTIEETLRWSMTNDIREPPQPYWHFGELLSFLGQRAQPSEGSCIITFNYDLAADFALQRRFAVDYSLTEDTGSSAYPLLKLHGSLNWFHCSTCDRIVPWDLAEFASEVLRHRDVSRAKIKLSDLSPWQHITNLGHVVNTAPILVPPTWNKGEHHRALARVWGRAARELKGAENIFVIGYSLPPTDEFFRHLYALGTAGDAILQRFWVFNPDRTDGVEQRFRDLLGPGAQQRFQYFQMPFGMAIPEIRRVFERS